MTESVIQMTPDEFGFLMACIFPLNVACVVLGLFVYDGLFSIFRMLSRRFSLRQSDKETL